MSFEQFIVWYFWTIKQLWRHLKADTEDWNATSFCHFWELCRVLGCIFVEFDNNLKLKWKRKITLWEKKKQLRNIILRTWNYNISYWAADFQSDGFGCLGSGPGLCPWFQGPVARRCWPGLCAAKRWQRQQDLNHTFPNSLSESPTGRKQLQFKKTIKVKQQVRWVVRSGYIKMFLIRKKTCFLSSFPGMET